MLSANQNAGGVINQPFFNEEDLKRLFGREDEKEELPPGPKPVTVEFQPEKPKLQEAQKIPESSIYPNSTPHFNDLFGVREERPSIFKLILRFLGTFLLIFVISYSLINGPALIMKMKYFWDTQYHNQQWATGYTVPAISSESRLIIPKIRTNVPIFWNVSQDQITQKLQDGVAHYEGTAVPGQVGNIFIFGHSSYYLWAAGSYKDVFALLNELSGGDKIYVQYNGAQFAYEVTGQTVVDPDDTSVLTQGNEKILSLMTCVPVGTNLKRLVVTAKQVGG